MGRCYKFVFILVTNLGERDYLPHQEAMMKAGLEKAVQHKDKLLEYDKNRYHKTHSQEKSFMRMDGFFAWCIMSIF